MDDYTGLIAFIAFMALGLSVIPLDVWLERRRSSRRHQAHRRR